MTITYTDVYSPLYLPRRQDARYDCYVRNALSHSGDVLIGQGPLSIKDGVHKLRAKNPDYKTQIARGINAGSNFTLTNCLYAPKNQTVRTLAKPDSVTDFRSNVVSTFVWDPYVFVDKADDLALKDLALKRLKSKIGSKASSIQALIPLAELRELRTTLSFLLGATGDLFKALVEIRRSRGRSALEFASAAWLNWSFAISPTFSEVQEISDMIYKILTDPGGQAYTERASAKKEWVSSVKMSNATSWSGNSRITTVCKHTLSYRYVAGFKVKLQSANDYSAASSLGLEPLQVIPAAWELFPFSWLLDYFTTMGDYFTDTYETRQYDSIYTSCTKKYICEFRSYVGPSEGMYIVISTVTGLPTEQRFFEIQRTMTTTVPGRIMRLKSIDEIGKNALNKFLNLSSILASGWSSKELRRMGL